MYSTGIIHCTQLTDYKAIEFFCATVEKQAIIFDTSTIFLPKHHEAKFLRAQKKPHAKHAAFYSGYELTFTDVQQQSS